jgi:preprotein translocase subunit YajC
MRQMISIVRAKGEPVKGESTKGEGTKGEGAKKDDTAAS